MDPAITRRMFVALSSTALCPGADDGLIEVKAKRKPSDEWKLYPTRTVSSLKGVPAKGIAVGKYGGRKDRQWKATGYFYPINKDGRWWLVDPEGRPFINVGVCSTSAGRSKTNRAALQEKFGTPEKWAEETLKLLRKYAFNGIGGWSDVDVLRGAPNRMSYTVSANFMSTFGKQFKLTYQQPGHTGYLGDAMPVFHPEFENFCDTYAKSIVEPHKNDPYLIGYFSDNELPMPKDWLDKFLQLDASNPALAPSRKAAEQWLAKRKNTKDINDDDREAFRGHIYDRYFALTTAALRKYDPNHLCLGSRLHGGALRSPAIMKSAGQFLDVIAVNVYGQWTPVPEMLAMWRKDANKPFVVTEFYAKGADSGFANTTGAGWLVPTQKDRAYFYQNFLLAMLESKACVGWHWFKYMDNDPEDLSTDPSNRDSNKGMVTIKYEPYQPLVDGMKELNSKVYVITDLMDK
jgi:hypothetical protein